ncbi:stage II sporulation protein M [Microbacterium sediminicola]
MDLDALTTARRAEWERLNALGRARRLSGEDVDELITRYRAASADLGDIKTSVGRTAHGDHLSLLLARARRRLTSPAGAPLARIPAFAARQLPAALYRLRWTTLVVAVAFLLIGGTVAAWISTDPVLLAALGSDADLRYYAENQFADYYSENPAAVFAGTVWTNNAWIAAQSVLFGITGFWPVMVLIQNAVTTGTAAAVLISFGHADTFALFILPHGQLELTSVFVAVAAGLHLFWSWVAPGPRTRTAALASEGRAVATIAIGLVFVLAVAGLIEGFVTAQPWPWPVKIGIGSAALAAFLVYMLVLGRHAFREGETGDLDEADTGTPQLSVG